MFRCLNLPVFTGHGLSAGILSVLSSSQLFQIVPGYYTRKQPLLSTINIPFQITVCRAVREMQNAELRMQNCGISCGNDLISRRRRHLHSAFCIHHSAFNSDSCLLSSNLHTFGIIHTCISYASFSRKKVPPPFRTAVQLCNVAIITCTSSFPRLR